MNTQKIRAAAALLTQWEKPAFDIGALALRVGAGGLMLVHGWPKLMQFFGDQPVQFMDPLGIGVAASLALATFAEFFCALLLVFGIMTRVAAAVLAVNMLVAVYALCALPWDKKELAVAYLVMYLAIVLIGGGRWGVSNCICRKLCKGQQSCPLS